MSSVKCQKACVNLRSVQRSTVIVYRVGYFGILRDKNKFIPLNLNRRNKMASQEALTALQIQKTSSISIESKRGRTFKFEWLMKYGLATTSRDPETNKIVSIRCRFCEYGRDAKESDCHRKKKENHEGEVLSETLAEGQH